MTSGTSADRHAAARRRTGAAGDCNVTVEEILSRRGAGDSMRVMLPITDAFDKIITDTIKSHAVEIRTLTDAAVVAAPAKMDVLGNPVSVSEFGRFGYIITASPHYKKTVAVLRLHSGRDKVFETQLTYPNDINIVFRLRDDAHPG